MNLPEEIQNHVARLRDTIRTTQELLPNARVNWSIYEAAIQAAERAVREQDTTAMVRLLPQLREMVRVWEVA